MKVKGAIVLVILFCFGFFYQNTVFAMVFTTPTNPIINELGHARTKEHGIMTGISYFLMNTFHHNPFLTPSDVVESDNNEIQALAKQLTADKETELEKSKAIYTWIIENIEYDADYYFQVQHLTDFDFDSAVETLQKRKSMCMGYAHLNAALHRAVGIETKVVYGNEHAWNEVLLDGTWQDQDSTKGAGFIDNQNRRFIPSPSMEYFTYSGLTKEGEYYW
ncbi:transglutaminase domain-containing protein [Bacillus marasmi]|uniref:transglutaminase domain-containing protein n=1 Tax=Bacillus marasmi TaxID=1926279 RepID=UPI0011C898D2|nr:transglutaminase-like domain-containing protein [Bacillus marasmi]